MYERKFVVLRASSIGLPLSCSVGLANCGLLRVAVRSAILLSAKPSSKYAYTCPYVFLTQVSKITLGIPVNVDLHDNIPVRFVS